MAFGLTIGTERATALQSAIQDELSTRGYSAEADPVMAEYITIMVINNKTPEQISSELEDLIGSDFDRSFTDWLFKEAARGAPESETAPAPQPSPPAPTSDQSSARDALPHLPRAPNGPRVGAPLYQQALSQISPTGHKRSASARSPSPNGYQPNKSRRTDLPTGPRAMARDGTVNGHGAQGGSRSLLERVGGRQHRNGRMNDEIQARIDNITANSPDPNMMAGFPNGMGGMDMNALAMGNPMVLQEMMMNQMALMAQMAGAMGIMNPAPGQFMNGNGFAMPVGMTPEMFAGMGGMQQLQQHMGTGNGNGNGNGQVRRGGGGGRGHSGGRGRDRGGYSASTSAPAPQVQESSASDSNATAASPIAAPVPQPATAVFAITGEPASAPVPSTSTSPSRTGFVAPERPQSPTLCKYALKCTNPLCRYSHPSPVATAESGMVLSNEACEAGRNCKDKDCIKAHVSPATLKSSEPIKPNPHVVPAPLATHAHIPCRFGVNCARIASGCPYVHPARPTSDKNHFVQQCRFGASCTRATCPFQHPEGRVLPSMFHKGLSTTAPLVNISTPETGSIGAPSPHRSVTFNKSKAAEELDRKVKELEEKKSQAEAAVKQAEAAAANKKDENKPLAIAA